MNRKEKIGPVVSAFREESEEDDKEEEGIADVRNRAVSTSKHFSLDSSNRSSGDNLSSNKKKTEESEDENMTNLPMSSKSVQDDTAVKVASQSVPVQKEKKKGRPKSVSSGVSVNKITEATPRQKRPSMAGRKKNMSNALPLLTSSSSDKVGFTDNKIVSLTKSPSDGLSLGFEAGYESLSKSFVSSYNTFEKNKTNSNVPSPEHPKFHIKDYQNFPLFATTTFGHTIKKVIEIVAPLVQDAMLRFAPDGMSISGVEALKMAILSANFESKLFYPWKCDRVFELAIDTPSLSRILQHVTKYDALTFFIPDKNQPQTLGIMMVKWEDNAYNYMPLVGNEIYKNKMLRMLPNHFQGFLELPAAAFQQYIHELMQTAQVVTFATDRKSFHMVTTGQQGGQYAPRHITIYPSDKGVKFLDNKPVAEGKVNPNGSGVKSETPFVEDEDGQVYTQTGQLLSSGKTGGTNGSKSTKVNPFLEEDEGDTTLEKMENVIEDEEVEEAEGQEEPTTTVDETHQTEPGGNSGNQTRKRKSTVTKKTAKGGSNNKQEKQTSRSASVQQEPQNVGQIPPTPNPDSATTRNGPEFAEILETMEKPLPNHFIKATYMLKYVYAITKATPLAKKVILLFTKNGPLITQYLIEHGMLTYCLAVMNPDQIR